jgi:hypothetical protein
MMDFLFGADMPLAVRFFFAFIIVLALIGGTAFLVRRFGGERLGASSSRGRQPRLAVIDAAAVDGRRRLILIRRDNVEHLLMIGGPSDVVVEANIVRAAAAGREAAGGRPQPAPADALPRPVQHPESNMWPLQPEPAPAPTPRPRQPAIDEMQWNEPEPPPLPLPPRRAETRPEPRQEMRPDMRPEMRPEPRPEMRPEPRQEMRAEMRPEPRPEMRPEPRPEMRPEPRVAEMREPRLDIRPEPRTADPLAGLAAELARVQPEPPPPPKLRAPPREAPREREAPRDVPRDLPRARAPQPERPRTIVPPPPPMEQPAEQDADQNLAEMAQRLEAALRRPKPVEPRLPEAPPRAAAPAAEPEPAPAAAHADDGPAPHQQAPARGAAPAKPQRSVYDSLEQEMASLLGRPNSKN